MLMAVLHLGLTRSKRHSWGDQLVKNLLRNHLEEAVMSANPYRRPLRVLLRDSCLDTPDTPAVCLPGSAPVPERGRYHSDAPAGRAVQRDMAGGGRELLE